jgi:DNA-binding Lrp family transcriptional regulator
MNLNIKDRKILYELDLDSRQSNKQIAKKVGLSEQVTGNRIKRLLDKGIIEYFFVRTNPSLLGYYHVKIYLRFHNITKKKEEEMLSKLTEKKGMFWLASLRGKYDLVASIPIKNLSDFSKNYEDIFGPYAHYIIDRNVVVLEKGSIQTRSYLLPNKKPQEIIYSKGSEKPIELDKTDFKLLQTLNKCGRANIIDIAQKIRVSGDTVRYRLSALKKKGIITGFGPKLNLAKIGNKFYMIFLRMQNMNKQKYAKLETFAKSNGHVIYFVKCFGDHDHELEVEIKNDEELDRFLKSLREHFVTEIKDYEIFEVTREHRMTFFSF